ncbi:MAG TPA: hypothetical protein VJ947_05480 [Pseudohaliea sp.]|nr:hypothetical protein [Pseudohaliea sp.]
MMHLPRRLIFVKPKKVGGSTLEFVLSSACGPDDTLTPLSVAEDCDRCRLGYQLPVNVFFSAVDEQRYHKALRDLCTLGMSSASVESSMTMASQLRRLAATLRQRTRVRNHASLKLIREFVGAAVFRETPLVSICRHPFELAVSQASWDRHKGAAGSLDEALDRVVSRPHINLRRYGLHRRWHGQRTPFTLILRLEELPQDMPLLSALVERDLPAELPRLKGDVREDRRPAEHVLSNAQKRAMERHNRPLFELWDSPPRP